MQRFAIQIAYDGTDYFGWQVQKRLRTVQSVMEKGLSEFCGSRTRITGAGRTDTGVHALNMTAHFDYKGSAHPEQIRKGLRRFLPPDIQIIRVIPVTSDFHARYDAMERHYKYHIALEETPFNRLYTGYFPRKRIRSELIRTAASYFLGPHDFSSFSRENPAVPDHICEIHQSDLAVQDDCLIYSIRADRFLHHMVRRMVGAMVSISHFEMDPGIIATWLAQKQSRQTMIFPAPAQGLFLVEVIYPPDKLKPDNRNIGNHQDK